MAYISGTAGSLADLLTTIKSGLTANGWALDGADVLYKGACQVELNITASLIRIRGGTGHGAGALTGAASFYAYIGTPTQAASAGVISFSFPVAYELYIFDSPDEVYLVVNSNVTDYQLLAFGISDVSGLPGNGTWFYATMGIGVAVSFGNAAPVMTVAGYGSGGSSNSNNLCCPMLLSAHGGPNVANGSIHHDYDGVGWAPGVQGGERQTWGTGGQTSWLKYQDPLLERQPSALNEGAPLIPLDVFAGRPSNNISLCLRLRHIRALRIDNYNPGQVVTYGPDSWKVYPWFRKSTLAADRNGSVVGSTNSGTMGWAIRYEGP